MFHSWLQGLNLLEEILLAFDKKIWKDWCFSHFSMYFVKSPSIRICWIPQVSQRETGCKMHLIHVLRERGSVTFESTLLCSSLRALNWRARFRKSDLHEFLEDKSTYGKDIRDIRSIIERQSFLHERKKT